MVEGGADAQAVERVKSGDKDAYRLLVDRHSRNLFRLAFRITGNEADAEDVVQEALLRAYRQIQTYDSRSTFSTWLYRIASNYALDLIRARGRHEKGRVTSAGEDQDVLDVADVRTPGQDRVLYSNQVSQSINVALGGLTPQERAAFLLRHCEGKSIEEIGGVLGLATSATKNSIFRAVKKMREALQPVVRSSHAT